METLEAMRTTGTCRRFRPDPVPDDVLHRAFDAARFAPQGGNRQPVRWVVVRDPATRRRLRDLYLPHWRRYLEARTGGEVDPAGLPRGARVVNEFAERLHEVPVLVVVCFEVDALLAADRDLGRLSIVGGASVYPTVQNFCLACRDLGVATAFTSLLCLSEPEVKALLAIPEPYATGGMLAVGFPARPWPRNLRRLPVEEIVHHERWGPPAT
jgi:nitroreductase